MLLEALAEHLGGELGLVCTNALDLCILLLEGEHVGRVALRSRCLHGLQLRGQLVALLLQGAALKLRLVEDLCHGELALGLGALEAVLELPLQPLHDELLLCSGALPLLLQLRCRMLLVALELGLRLLQLPLELGDLGGASAHRLLHGELTLGLSRACRRLELLP